MSAARRCVLRLNGVGRKEKDPKTGTYKPILENIALQLPEGRLVALVGADGAGKTTLMRIMAGILPPSEGSVEVMGEDFYASLNRLQRYCGYMPQKFGLYEDLSLMENFTLYADLFGLNEEQRQKRFSELLQMTGLGPFTARPAGKLSGGMKQKLGLACVLLNQPKVLLLDEPSVGVDPLSREQLWKILQANVRDESMAVVVATTYMDEAQLCDEVLVLEEGRMRLSGTPEAIARYAQGRTFQAKDAPTVSRPVRLLQAQLLDACEWILDAVPEADGVRVTTQASVTQEDLQRAFASVVFTERPATLEDGYLCYRENLAQQHEKKPQETAGYPDDLKDVEEDAEKLSEDLKEAICAKDLVRKFGDFVAVDKTSFTVAPGEVFGLLGPNGAGKTTTFKMLCGLLEVTAGELSVAGVDVRRYREIARENLGYMSQKFSLYADLTVRENLEFFAGAYGLTGSKRRDRIETLACEFELADKLEVNAGDLSGGYKQRLSMAVAVLHRPRILFLDEPTSGADIPTRRRFWRWITALSKEGTTVVVTTHFMQEALYCDRILIQDAGKTLVLGTPQQVRAASPTMNDAFIRIVREARNTKQNANGGGV